MVYATLFGVCMLSYLFGGYVLVLLFYSFVKGSRQILQDSEPQLPSVTILITVFNEVNGINARIKNVLSCEYPGDRLDILVASDGSTDGTDELVKSIKDSRVSLFRPTNRQGKTDTQNRAIALAKGDVVIFTDADTRFDTRFIKEIVKPFEDPAVGGVDGHLLFIKDAVSGVSHSQGFYWRQELAIRALESQLGILAVASGACMAVKRSIFRPMIATVGEDCLIPLDVIDQGYKMIHAEQALAFDRMEHEPAKEFRTRVRMTLRNWQGTWLYPKLLNPFRHPGVAWSLWSHKILRWLSPLFLFIWLFGSVVLLWEESLIWNIGIPGLLFIVNAIAGVLRVPLPGASICYSFILANAGFFIGVLKALVGQKIITYR